MKNQRGSKLAKKISHKRTPVSTGPARSKYSNIVIAPLPIVDMSSRARSHKGMKLNIWTEEDMMAALREYHTAAGTRPSLRQLTRTWNVPVATLFKRIRKGVLEHEHKSGRNTVLSASQESDLAELIITHLLMTEGERWLIPLMRNARRRNRARRKGRKLCLLVSRPAKTLRRNQEPVDRKVYQAKPTSKMSGSVFIASSNMDKKKI